MNRQNEIGLSPENQSLNSIKPSKSKAKPTLEEAYEFEMD